MPKIRAEADLLASPVRGVARCRIAFPETKAMASEFVAVGGIIAQSPIPRSDVFDLVASYGFVEIRRPSVSIHNRFGVGPCPMQKRR
jgi:hypothetical protein